MASSSSLESKPSGMRSLLPHQPSWLPLGADDAGGPGPLLEGDLYKDTKLGDLVVLRRVQLFHNRLVTYHNFQQDPKNNKVWILDAGCTVRPAAADGIVAVKRQVRPNGVWAITSALGQAKLEPVEAVSGVPHVNGKQQHKAVGRRRPWR